MPAAHDADRMSALPMAADFQSATIPHKSWMHPTSFFYLSFYKHFHIIDFTAGDLHI